MEEGLNYTLCFIKRGQKILMLNRENPSWMGSWNGVGGRIEKGETPEACILREVYEETAIELDKIRDCGILTWDTDGVDFGGMHIFLAELDESYEYMTPRGTKEGILDWKNIDWILNPENTGIIKNIQRFLPKMLESRKRYAYACVYEGYELVEFLDKEI